MLRHATFGVLTVAMSVVLVSCGGGSDLLDPLSGGEASVDVHDRNAFALPLPTLTESEHSAFNVGDSFFTEPWTPAPGPDEARDGLGPLFDAVSCEGCHVRDGRGAPDNPDGIPPGVIYRTNGLIEGVSGALQPGDQIHRDGIPPITPLASVEVAYEELTDRYADGTAYTLRRPIYRVRNAEGTAVDVAVSARVAPVIAGAGLLEAVPLATLEALVSEQNRDGISGRLGTGHSAATATGEIGRFGWKGTSPSLLDQTALALHHDLGITNSLHPEQNCTTTACAQLPDGGSPEIDDSRLEKIVFYTATLAVPTRRNLDDPAVIAGADLFTSLGCAVCHRPTLKTGDNTIEALANQTIHPYTDMLMHDMGPGLADGDNDRTTDAAEWRTPPLWGLGLIETVNGHTYLLHDGRARSIEEAILWHGGEAVAAQRRFVALDAKDRERVLAFLRSL